MLEKFNFFTFWLIFWHFSAKMLVTTTLSCFVLLCMHRVLEESNWCHRDFCLSFQTFIYGPKFYIYFPFRWIWICLMANCMYAVVFERVGFDKHKFFNEVAALTKSYSCVFVFFRLLWLFVGRLMTAAVLWCHMNSSWRFFVPYVTDKAKLLHNSRIIWRFDEFINKNA